MKQLTLIAASLLVTVSSTVIAQTPPPPPPAEAKTSAAPYVAAAGTSDLYEVNSSQIAMQKSQSPEVRRFAAMLVKHHQKTTTATMKAARKAGLNPPAPTLDPGAKASIDELQSASAVDFDRLYLGQQVPAHQAALDLHQNYAANGDQAALRMSARSAIPIVKSHLTAATRMQAGVGAHAHSGM